MEATARLEVIAHRTYSTSGMRARSLSPKPASIYSKNSFLTASARYGTRARLYCDIKARPLPHLRWYKNHAPLNPASDKYRLHYDGEVASLEIYPVEMEDGGLYSCVATNEHGTAQTAMLLEVTGAEPLIVKPLPLEIAVQNEGCILEFYVQGAEPLEIVWMKDGCLIPAECREFKQEFNSEEGVARLIVGGTECLGRYTCEVYNLYGEASTKCTVIKAKTLHQVSFFFSTKFLLTIYGRLITGRLSLSKLIRLGKLRDSRRG